MGETERLTLLAATTITGDGTVNGSAVTMRRGHDRATFTMTVSGKSMDASTTLDIWVQLCPDGTVWDDLVHFSQLTNAAVGNGSYMAFVNADATSAVDRVTTDGTLAANSVRAIPFGDQLRVKYTSNNFAGTDTVTVTVKACLQ